MKRLAKIMVLVLVLSLGLVACSNDQEPVQEDQDPTSQSEQTQTSQEENIEYEVEDEGESQVEDTNLMMATTTSTDNTGLLDELEQMLLEDTGINLEWVSVGTGEALRMGQDGEVDIVLVHAKDSEEEFVEEGYGIDRVPVMYNDFIIVGPSGQIENTGDVLEFLENVYNNDLKFVTRGDDSGTHKMELSLWEELGIDPEENPNYIDAGQGMGASLGIAAEEDAFILTDRATYLSTQASEVDISNLEIIVEGDTALFNQYGVIAVSDQMYPDTNIQAAQAFIDWITSEEIQDLIGQFGQEEFGQALFVPNADDPDA